MKTRRILALAIACLLVSGCAGFNAESLDRILNKPLDSETVAAGLKEALRIGTERSTNTTSAVDGFYGNAAIRVALPEQYDSVAKAIRDIGLGSQVDQFELSMNRAAEKASAEAVEVFWDSITRMSISDAFGILNGEDNAATEYFRRQTSSELMARFQPIVISSMKEVGVYRIHEDLVARYNMLPIAKPEAVDLDDYITERTVDGIFLILEGEEKKIRDDPAARTTELLRKVFG
ncbi:MAG: DUF4197 domain-containing protein [Candidatus Krumholzibacteriota bacterium]